MANRDTQPGRDTQPSRDTQPNAVREVFLDDCENGRTSISRRTLLRGTGAALALPWLEAMMG